MGGAIRRKRQDINNINDQDLCEGRQSGEYFRLTGDDDCRDVVRCSVQGLLALRCPSGLAFDIDKQTCTWKDHVTNCDLLDSECPEEDVRPIGLTKAISRMLLLFCLYI